MQLQCEWEQGEPGKLSDIKDWGGCWEIPALQDQEQHMFNLVFSCFLGSKKKGHLSPKNFHACERKQYTLNFCASIVLMGRNVCKWLQVVVTTLSCGLAGVKSICGVSWKPVGLLEPLGNAVVMQKCNHPGVCWEGQHGRTQAIQKVFGVQQE